MGNDLAVALPHLELTVREESLLIPTGAQRPAGGENRKDAGIWATLTRGTERKKQRTVEPWTGVLQKPST